MLKVKEKQNGSSKKKGGKGRQQQPQSNQSNQSGSTKQRGNSGGPAQGPLKCSHCGKLGHSVDNCWCRDNPRGTRPSTASSDKRCFRCNRVGHTAARCYADRHTDGRVLQPNGVPKPERSADSNAAQASNPTTSNVSLGVCATSHLNCQRGASSTPAARPNHDWY